MKKITLLIFLAACLVFLNACQNDVGHDQEELKKQESKEQESKEDESEGQESGEQETEEQETKGESKEQDSRDPESEINDSENKTESETSKTDEELAFPNTEKTVYLTFDDGPSSATMDILHTLDQFDAEATFFMLEPYMRELPGEVNAIAEEGHALGLHGVTHNKDQFYKSEQSALDEMTTAQRTLKKITGIQTNLIRTPYGSVPYLTESYREVLDSNGFKLWDWNADSDDWSLSGDQYINRVIQQVEELENVGVAPIILMHDQQHTADHLPALLTYLSEHGFQTKKIDDKLQPYNFNCYDRCHELSANKKD